MKTIITSIAILMGMLLPTGGHAELHVVQPTGVTVVKGYKIPEGEEVHEEKLPPPAVLPDSVVAELAKSIEQECQKPEEGDTGPFPGAIVKFDTLFVPIRGQAKWLPPDPGSAGKSTIEGVDSDGDCVRDDIENFIARKYPKKDQQKLRGHLFNFAKYLGLFLKPGIIREVAAYYSQKMFVATTCARRELDEAPTTSKDLDMIFAKFHNTLERSYRYIDNNKLLGGTSSLIPEEINCDLIITPITP